MDYALHMVYIRKNMHNFGYPGAPARGLFAGMEVTKQSTLRSWTATAVPGVPSPPNRHLVDRQIVARCGPRIGYPHDTSDRFGRFGRWIFRRILEAKDSKASHLGVKPLVNSNI